MGIIICIAGQKGGVGKSTSSVNLSAAFALFEKRTLLVDCDPMKNATTFIGFPKTAHNLYHALSGEIAVKDTLLKSEISHLDVLPAGFELSLIEKKLLFKPQKERVLYTLVQTLIDDYDYIVIDCPPSLGFLTACGIVAADHLLIPISCRLYGLEGLDCFFKFVREINTRLQTKTKIAGLFFTWCRCLEDIYRQFPPSDLKRIENIAFSSTIPPDRCFMDRSGFGKPIVLHDLMAKGANAYLDLAFDVIRHCHSSI